MPPGKTKTVLLIAGMKDNGCREIVTEALGNVRGVREVHVNLYRGHAIISHEAHCEAADLIAAVQRAGYGASLDSQAIGRPPLTKNPGSHEGPGDSPAKETSS
jgi:copper chaperone CopZ